MYKLCDIDTICLSGGGIKGISFIGCLKYISKYINIYNIKNWYATSVGAIVILFIILDYNIDEIEKFILNFNFSKIMSLNLNNIVNNIGLDDGKKFNIFLKYFIKYKLNKDDISLIDLYKLTNKNINFIGTNLTKRKTDLINHINFPNMSLITAIRITTCIPIFYIPINYNNDYYVDGAVSNNFPIDYCIDKKYISFCIRSEPITNLNNIFDVFNSCIDNIINNKDYCNIINDYVIYINLYRVNIMNYNLNYDEKKILIDDAYDIIKKHFDYLNTLIEYIN
jgi:predicted patatin/cPLA2 family phospholipase